MIRPVYEPTVPLFEAILNAQIETHGKGSPVTAFTEMGLGTLKQQNHVSGWEKHFEECLQAATRNNKRGASAHEVEMQMQITASYTNNLINDKRYGTALEYLPIQNTYNAKMFSPKSYIYAEGMLKTAEAQLQTGKLAEAIKTVQTAKVHTDEPTSNSEQLDTIVLEATRLNEMVGNQASPYTDINKLLKTTDELIDVKNISEAIENLLRTLNFLDVAYSKSDPLILQSRLKLATLYLIQNDPVKAAHQLKVFVKHKLTESTADGFDALYEQCTLQLYETQNIKLIDDLTQTLAATETPGIQELLRIAVSSVDI